VKETYNLVSYLS